MTLDDVRARMKAAGLEIAEDRLEMVRRLLSDALAPIHALARLSQNSHVHGR